MYTSIPYDEGWKITVDGKSTPAESIKADAVADGALIALRLNPGRHSISFCYATPGFISGVLISLAAALLLAGATVLRKKLKLSTRTFVPSDPDNIDNRPYPRSEDSGDRRME